ncbi:MAG TPA: hypothetical protein VN026_18060 [Bacteroidia bacterium]|nr:hypothetical protein [Bacteroidia bacterium]
MNKLNKAVFILAMSLLGTSSFAQEEGNSPKETKTGDDKRFQEIVPTDSVPAAKLVARAVNWVKVESKRFVKSNGVSTGSKAECIAKFKIRAKELNPQPDYTGIIQMHVSIECKDNKYRYSITQIKHISANGKASGGDINNLIPECGSMTMPDLTWKKIKGEAFKSADMVISELKEGMSKSTADKDEW